MKLTRIFLLCSVIVAAIDTECAEGQWLKTVDNGGRHLDLVISSATCRACSPGYYCPGGEKRTQVKCAPGTYSAFGQVKCTSCPEGFACADPAARPVPCGITTSAGGQVSCTYSGKGASECTVWSLPTAETTSSTNHKHRCTAEGKLEVVQEGRVSTLTTITLPDTSQKLEWLDAPCPPGSFCNDYEITNGVVVAVGNRRCPKGTYAPAGSVGCTTCPPGHYCPADASNDAETAAIAATKCPKGWYQNQPGQTSCVICRKGYYCAEGASYEKKCALGAYSPSDGSDACQDCPAGYECPDSTAWPVPCGKTMYSLGSQAQCFDCPYGSECPQLKTLIACQSGYYTHHEDPCSVEGNCPQTPTWENEGKHYCKECPAGSQCKRADLNPVQCPQGYYSYAGSVECTPCPPGSMCPSISEGPSACKKGFYQDESGQSFCKKCLDGHTCVSPASAPVKCADNQLTDISHQSCIALPLGYAAPTDRLDDITPCAAGTFSLVDMKECLACPRGKYCPKSTAEGVACPTGTYTAGDGQTFCNQVLPGWKHVDTTGVHYYKCLPGQYSDANNVCKDCPAGSACPESHQEAGHDHKYECPAGSYSNSTQTHCTPCPPGFACQTNQALPAPCGDGKYSLGGWSACVDCPLNYQCPRKNTISICPAYHTSPAGNLDCEPCPQGHECKDMSQGPQECPIGYYGDTLDRECQQCPIGHKCAAGSIVPVACPLGTYQSSQAMDACLPCPSGYFTAKTKAEFCQIIPGGWKGTGTNKNEGIAACPAGTYSDWGVSDCSTCPDGFICPPATVHSHQWENSCPRGSFCKGGVMTPCPAGKTGISERAITEEEGCYDCPAGYYCPEKNGNWELYPCPRGGYCSGGKSEAELCPPGYYNDLLYGQSAADCKLCPAGHQCAGGSENNGVICPEGSYCPRGSKPGKYLCPKGTYGGKQAGLKDVSECLICPPGMICAEGTVTPAPSPKGSYQPNSGIGDAEAVYLCPPKYYCPETGMTNYKGYPCKAGYYCPAGSTKENPNPCPAGTYSDRRDLHNPQDCTICPRGYMCKAGDTSKTIADCEANHYCIEGTLNQASSQVSAYSIHTASHFKMRECPAGYKSNTNAKSLEDCVKCDYGTYCLARQGEVPCPKGHYCPLATRFATQFACPAGYFNDALSKIDILDCQPCGVGYTCLEGAESKTACPAGSYNSLSNTESSCQPCPAGSYCVADGMAVNSHPHPKKCPAGSYSDEEAVTCIDCKVGHYCPNIGTTKYEMEVDQICPAGTLCVRVIDGTTITSVQAPTTPNIDLKIGIAAYPDDQTHGCPKGHYCPKGTGEKKACPKGTYNPSFARGDKFNGCRQIQPGQYVDTEGAIEKSGDCAAGHYCPLGSASSTQNPCPVGTFRSLVGGQDPESCGICPSGYYCNSVALVDPVLCPAGFYCAVGTIYPETCPIGTYGPNTGLTDSWQCTPCQAGKYCWKKGETTQSAAVCDQGFFCSAGASRPEPTDNVAGMRCPKGATCARGTTDPALCPKGKHNPNQGAFDPSIDCVECYAGYQCPKDGTSESDVKCPAGYYCPQGTGVPGTGLSKQTDAGYYAASGFSQQYKCPKGTYQPLTGKESCQICTDGFVCDAFGLSAMA